MKRLLAAVALGLLAPALVAHAQLSGQVSTVPAIPQAASMLATAAPQQRADGTAGVQIADREGNTKATSGHGLYTESARRGRLFSLAANAYTVIAANATTGAIGTFKPIVGFYNPIGSPVNAVIINHREWSTSGTPGGPFIFNFFCGQNWNSAAGGTIYNNLLSASSQSGSYMVPQNNTVVTTNPAITTAMNAFVPAGGDETTILTTSSGEAGHAEDDQGQIVVPPGCLFAIASTATGTSQIVSASLTWEEVAP